MNNIILCFYSDDVKIRLSSLKLTRTILESTDATFSVPVHLRRRHII